MIHPASRKGTVGELEFLLKEEDEVPWLSKS